MITSSPSNRSGTGILTLAADKTTLNTLASKTGSADLVAMRTANPLAFEALERWIASGDIRPGTPLIRHLDARRKPTARRLSGNGVSEAIKLTVQRNLVSTGLSRQVAATQAAAYSGHSGRVGLIGSAVRQGVEDSVIMNLTRHSSPKMIAHYANEVRQEVKSPTLVDGVGLRR